MPEGNVHIHGEPIGAAPHDDAIGKHVVVVIVPLAGEARKPKRA
jgi:hypothetical protein